MRAHIIITLLQLYFVSLFRLCSSLFNASWKKHILCHCITISRINRTFTCSLWSMTLVFTRVCSSACKDMCSFSNSILWSLLSDLFCVLHITGTHTLCCLMKYVNYCLLLPFTPFLVDLFCMVLGVLWLNVSGRHEVMFVLVQCNLHFVRTKTKVYIFFVQMFLCTADWYRMENIFFHWDLQLLFERFVDVVYVLANHM
jgi:hypothetical protein